MTISLVDIVPQTRNVETAHGTLTLRGLGLRHIADLFLRFDEIAKFFSGRRGEIDVGVLLTEMPEVAAAIIAEAARQPDAAEQVAEAFTPDDAVACLLAIQEMTIPPPFFDRLAALLGNAGLVARPNGKAADMPSPPPPST